MRQILPLRWMLSGLALVLLTAALPAWAARDVVHFGSSIDVAKGDDPRWGVLFLQRESKGHGAR